jgi:4'-phosphopantetheinyl transferase EntD
MYRKNPRFTSSVYGVRIEPRIASLFTDGVIAAATSSKVPPHELYAEEREFVARSAEKRQVEFASGRMCARVALAKIGYNNFPLLVSKDRFPEWPSGVSGSISHSNSLCLAVVGPKKKIAGIGIDVEELGRVVPDLWPIVFSSNEINFIMEFAGRQRAKAATAMFGAKEAFFKCQFPITRTWLDFLEVSVAICGSSFRISIGNREVARRLCASFLEGRLLADKSHMISGIFIPS